MSLNCLYQLYNFRACTFVSWLLPFTFIDGLSILNEDGGLKVFFPNNSFVTNSTLTHTNTPRDGGNDHIVCYGMGQFNTAVTWRNSGGERLVQCEQTCQGCGVLCRRNGGVGVDPTLLKHTHIHMYTNSSAYVNQDLQCRWFGLGHPSSFIGVYLKDGGESCLFKYSIPLLKCEAMHSTHCWLIATYEFVDSSNHVTLHFCIISLS